jgi:hypothetical protein
MNKGKRVLTVLGVIVLLAVVIGGGITIFNWVKGLGGGSEGNDIIPDGGNQTENIPPVAKLFVNNTNLRVGELFNLSGAASKDPDGGNDTDNGIRTYHYYYGDGNDVSGPNADSTYAYIQPGNYTITLKVYDADGATDEDSVRVKVVWPDEIIQPNPAILLGEPRFGILNTTAEYSWEVKTGAKVMTMSISIAGANVLEMQANKVNATLLDPTGRTMNHTSVEVLGNRVIEWDYGEDDLGLSGTYMVIIQCYKGGAYVSIDGRVSYA